MAFPQPIFVPNLQAPLLMSDFASIQCSVVIFCVLISSFLCVMCTNHVIIAFHLIYVSVSTISSALADLSLEIVFEIYRVIISLLGITLQ